MTDCDRTCFRLSRRTTWQPIPTCCEVSATTMKPSTNPRSSSAQRRRKPHQVPVSSCGLIRRVCQPSARTWRRKSKTDLVLPPFLAKWFHRLQNNAVSRKSAQAASCLKASDFDKALQIVQAAIGGSRKQIGSNEVYDNLIRQYELSVDRSFLVNWLNGVEKTLLQSKSDLNPDDPAMGPRVKYAAFYWIHNVYTVRPSPGFESW